MLSRSRQAGVRDVCVFASRVAMRRNYRRGRERRGWSSHKRSHHPLRQRRPGHNNRAQRQVRAACAYHGLSRWVLRLIKCAEWWLSRIERVAIWRFCGQYFWSSIISVIRTGSGIALISESLLCVDNCTLIFNWDAVPLASPFSCALSSINPSSICKDSSGKKNIIT